MSRIGKKPIPIPSGVSVKISNSLVEVKGSKGVLSLSVPSLIGVAQEGEMLVVSPTYQTRESRKLWGTVRALIANMIAGVTQGFEKKLEIEGVGYRAMQKGKDIELSLGFSHPVLVTAPESVTLGVEKNTITVSGVSKELVGRIAAEIRALKKPEPYKGKGIRYVGEVIRRKAGKKATTTG